ncbi:MAG: four helix bundle protein [Ramlibacter sp.]
MALHTDLQIHKTGVELLTLAADVQSAIPRSFRNFGNRISDECTELLVQIARANAAKGQGKVPHIEQLLERLEVVTVLMRVAHAKRLVAQKLWAQSMQLTGSIGRQAGGWLKASRSAPAA